MLLNILVKYGARKSTPDELYTRLFHIGAHYILRQGEYRAEGSEDFKVNPIVYINDRENYKGKMKRYILLEDTFLEQLREARKEPSNLLNAVSYYGRKKDKEHADRCFGLIFDIDDVDDVTLNRFLYGCQDEHRVYPTPNFLVVSRSGRGVHLYYIFDEPVRLYPKIKVQLKSLKYGMTKWLWNQYTSNNEKVQYQSYDQSFMIAGTKENMTVWCLRDECYKLEELFSMAQMEFNKEELWIESQYTLEEAKKKFPQWYEKVIVNGEHEKGHWKCKRDLYDWWIRKLLHPVDGATYGHRYWCIMMLVIYAVKCGIPYEEVKKQAYDLVSELNSRKPDQPFTVDDVNSALECYDVQFATFPIDDISRLSGISIEKNKRNGLKQKQHLYLARRRKEDMKAIDLPMKAPEGRPPQEQTVREWRRLHPNGKKADCIRETGLSKPTVYKWWEEKKYRVDFGDGVVSYMTKAEVVEFNQSIGAWHKELPAHYVIDGEPDMMAKMSSYASQGIRSVEILSKEEYEYLIAKK